MDVPIEPMTLESLRRLNAEWVAEGARLEGQQARTELARLHLENAVRTVVQQLVPGVSSARIDLDRGVIATDTGGDDGGLPGNA